ncbi:uncharacterized protein LOC134245382 [Saccostrea cucullata]|uniref:uncharacterized protein LOC134245382 n=1 Tax=Saccostrea cuccullata TaxID=36930 RepID=UPI002ED05BE1
MGERRRRKKRRKGSTGNVSETHVSVSEGEGENSSLMNALESANRILYGTPNDDQNTSTPIATKPSVEVNDDIRQQICENTKMLNMILQKLHILDEIQAKLLRIDSDVTSIKQQVSEVTNKASKLEHSVTFISDTIDDIQKHGGVNAIRNKLSVVEAKTTDLENSAQNTHSRLSDIENREVDVQAVRNVISKLDCEMKRHSTMIEKKTQTDERITGLQYHTMKMNLVFTGVWGESRGENTEQKLRAFLMNELDIDYHIEFVNIHSFGRFQRGKPRPIVARFIYQADIDAVLEKANWLRGTPYRIHRQFPAAMDERRRSLIPVMKQFIEDGANVKLVRDRLIVNGQVYDPDSYDCEPTEPMNYARAVQSGANSREESDPIR